VAIIEKGLSLLERMSGCKSREDNMLKGLSEEEVKELNRLLDKIRDHQDTGI
jgi:DNA-binding MarR family transcriptional regulator